MESHPALQRHGEQLKLGDEYYVLASSLASRRRTHVLAHGDTFVVLDQSGDIPFVVEEGLGLFHRGTRYLCQLEMLVGDDPPFFLSARVTPDNLHAVANLTNGDIEVGGRMTPRSTLSIRRTTLVCGPQMLVRLVLHSFSLEPLSVPLEFRFASDFIDVFEVRGIRRERGGTVEPSRRDGDALVLGYRGIDGVRRETRCELVGAEPRWDGERARLEIALGPQEEGTLDLVIDCRSDEGATSARHRFGGAEAVREQEYRRWQAERAV